ncbi:MAG: cell envelope biogenesis protein OmpA [Desulfovibrio sp.]|jgi:ABC-type nitrate/sulfonate/bicarbonate transport system substrate-binding protein|nr:cell envelope biogenesis protein OmpA [Desulfovibrio sp.]
MKRFLTAVLLLAVLSAGMGCTNMSRTQQAIVSGAVIGAAGGAGMAMIAGGAATTSIVAGAVLGGLGGGILTSQNAGYQ